MIRGTRIAIVLGAVVLLASACGTTDGDTPFAPEVKPAFSTTGGFGMGGNVMEEPAPEETQAAGTVGEGELETPSDSTSRGGGFGMGGN
jgi:ABC-type glycerol-3-phosphate transport system substrate-binding protein